MEGWLRVGSHLHAIAQMAGFVSPRLGIRFDPGEGPDNLRIVHPDGTPFATFDELDDQRQAEVRRAEEERRRAEGQALIAQSERQRADEERRRAERLASRLRELGIEPE